MSGLEIPGLIFGVLPVFVQVLQSYRNIHDTLHAFRHYSREVKRIKIQFKIQHHNFQNECSLLQYIIAGEDTFQTVWDDKDRTSQRNASLEEHLNKRIDDSHQTCEDIVNDIKKELDEMEEDLKSFGVLKNEKRQHEKLKATINRVRNSIKVVFDKDRYIKRLTKLRESNMDLHTFRMQIEELLKRRSDTVSLSKIRKRLPPHYSSVQKVSQTLHEALSNAWNCPYSGHKTHYGKLCVEAQVQNVVRLDLALSYKPCQTGDSSSSSEDEDGDHVWVYVQSVSIETNPVERIQKDPVSTTSSCDDLSTALCMSQRNRRDTNISLALQSVTQAQKYKRRKVQPADDCTLPQSYASTAAEAFNIREVTIIRDLCRHIEKAAHSSRAYASEKCIGYLEAPRLFKHIFYSTERAKFGNSTGKGCLTEEVINLEYLLYATNREPASVDVGSKFKIAHRIATAVLQYHSTPWLRDDWRLKDLAYFGNLQGVSDESLRTLHLTSCFNQSDQDPEWNSTRWGANLSPDSTYSSIESIHCQYGINNTVLFSLGVALLELAYHRPLEQMCDAQDPIVAARKQAMSGYPLGLKYQRIVRQCLQCDFGMGSDMKEPELQSAIYGDVICSLEEMMSSLSFD